MYDLIAVVNETRGIATIWVADHGVPVECLGSVRARTAEQALNLWRGV